MTALIDRQLADPGVPRARRTRVPAWAWLPIGVLLFSFARIASGANELDSAGTLGVMIDSTVPIALAALAGLWSERAGIVNIGLEGMMILGTLGAGYFGYHHGPWAGVLGAIAFGALGGVLHAIASVIFAVDQIVSGVAITIMAGGATAFLAQQWFANAPGGGETQSPPVAQPTSITIDSVANWSKDIENHHWFGVSDLASVLGAFTRGLSTLALVAVALIVVSAWILWRSSFGLRLRSCGESPTAAETLGVHVLRYKFVAVTISGGIAGLGGGYLVLVSSNFFQNGQTGGRGYIGLAAMIFGNWRPSGLVIGSTLFGYTDALQLRAGGGAVRALLIIVAIVLFVYALIQLRNAKRVTALVMLVLSGLFTLWFLFSDEVPSDFVHMTPYVTTLLVLALASQRLRMPAADGLPYRKGQAE
jgi:general nucleoside transport system permease protein